MDVYREGRNWLCPSLPLAAGPLQAPNVHTRGSTSLCLLFIPYIHFQTSLDVYREDRNWLCPSLSLAAWPLQAPNVHTRGSASLCLLFIPYIHFQTSLEVYRGIKRRTPLGMSLYALLVPHFECGPFDHSGISPVFLYAKLRFLCGSSKF